MARSDLLIRLFRAGSADDKTNFHHIAETIIAEEKEKRHTVLASRLSEAIRTNGTFSQILSYAETEEFCLDVMRRATLDHEREKCQKSYHYHAEALAGAEAHTRASQ